MVIMAAVRCAFSLDVCIPQTPVCFEHVSPVNACAHKYTGASKKMTRAGFSVKKKNCKSLAQFFPIEAVCANPTFIETSCIYSTYTVNQNTFTCKHEQL
jgi:hypothetical protein